MSVLTSPDPLRNAYGIVDFEILADPNQPRVRAVHIKTGDGGTFTFAIDPEQPWRSHPRSLPLHWQ